MSGIEEIAKSWLLDPQWQKVFKHTVDVMEDYISYLLVSLMIILFSNFEYYFYNLRWLWVLYVCL